MKAKAYIIYEKVCDDDGEDVFIKEFCTQKGTAEFITLQLAKKTYKEAKETFKNCEYPLEVYDKLASDCCIQISYDDYIDIIGFKEIEIDV